MARKAPPKAPPKKAIRSAKPTSHAGGPKKAEPAPTRASLTPDLPAPEIVAVRSRRVACDGVGGALGHPRVWLEMGEGDFVECPYCDRRFVLATGSEGAEDERLAPGVYEGSHGH